MLPTVLRDSFELRYMKDSFPQSEREPHQKTPNLLIYKKHGMFVIGQASKKELSKQTPEQLRAVFRELADKFRLFLALESKFGSQPATQIQ